MIKLLIVCKP